MSDPNFTNRYFVGAGLDIGGKPDPLSIYKELFSRMDSVRTWDWEDGDAQFLQSVSDGHFDFVHSSHCLEHLVDPRDGIKNWFRVLRPGGYLIVTVPDEDLYEQGVFPSTFNRDHKWTFTTYKARSWSEKSINLIDIVRELGEAAELVRLEQLSATYRFALPRYDQTLTPVGECGIELIVRKRPAAEVAAGGRWQRTEQSPERELRVHLNQYRNDLKTLKETNQVSPPFTDDTPL
ncbi:methyltransferase domain-containing protein [Lysobacter terrae]